MQMILYSVAWAPWVWSRINNQNLSKEFSLGQCSDIWGNILQVPYAAAVITILATFAIPCVS